MSSETLPSSRPTWASREMTALLELEDVRCGYGPTSVLHGVSLAVPEGGIVSLLGANGAGKTTTLRAISNLLRAERGEVTKGSIHFNAERVDKLNPSELV